MQQTIFAPYLRTTPLHEQRRDLVAYATDSLTLRVTVVESDSPGAQLLTLTGGLGGPAAQLLIWTDYRPVGRSSWLDGGCGCDYDRPLTAGGSVLWSGMGTPQIGLGSFDFFLPAGTLLSVPSRCGWAVQLGWDSQKSDVLFAGTLQVRGGGRFGPVPPFVMPLLTDTSIPVMQDDGTTATFV
jgi:hypothetical protein